MSNAEAAADRLRAAGLRIVRGSAAYTLISVASSTPVLALVVAVVTWPPLQVTPAVGLDPSWVTGLVMATHRGLDFGTQVIFTYGPLGFLRLPLTMYGGLAVLSTVYVLAVRVGLAATVLWVTRQRLPLWASFVVAVAASLITTPDAIVVIVFLWCAVALLEQVPPRLASIVIYGGAFVAGVEVLVKLNSGLVVLAMGLVTAVAMKTNRLAHLARFLATFVLTLAGCWFASGQGVGNADDYFRAAFDVISGYSGAMAISAGRRGVIEVAVLLICVTLGAWILATRRLPRARAGGLVAIVALLSLLAWKEGFVREDAAHVGYFFSWMAAPWIALTWIRGWGRIAGLAGFAAIVMLFYGGTGYYPWREWSPVAGPNPIANTRMAVTDIYDWVDPSQRGRLRNQARTRLALQYRLDAEIRRMIGNKPVAIYPTEISLAWAYDLNWRPLPVFQPYAGYTPLLDDRNADALESASGPTMILRQVGGGIDGRYPHYDTPAATLEMLCNFRVARTTTDYQLLERVPDRCGAPRAFDSVDADYGQTVEVPRPPRAGDAVFARVSGLNPTGVERLRALLYKPTFRWLTIDGKWTYRLVSATAGDGLLLSTPPSRDFSAPRFESALWSWKLAPRPNASTVSFEKNSGIASPRNRLQIEFYAMPVRAAR
jgi:hypothetical protein